MDHKPQCENMQNYQTSRRKQRGNLCDHRLGKGILERIPKHDP